MSTVQTNTIGVLLIHKSFSIKLPFEWAGRLWIYRNSSVGLNGAHSKLIEWRELNWIYLNGLVGTPYDTCNPESTVGAVYPDFLTPTPVAIFSSVDGTKIFLASVQSSSNECTLFSWDITPILHEHYEGMKKAPECIDSILSVPSTCNWHHYQYPSTSFTLGILNIFFPFHYLTILCAGNLKIVMKYWRNIQDENDVRLQEWYMISDLCSY